MFEGSDQAQGAGAPTGAAADTAAQGAAAGATAATTTVEEAPATPTSSGANGSASGTASTIPDEAPAEDGVWEALPKWIRDLRKENAAHRTKLRATEADLNTTRAELETYKQKDLSDVEKAQNAAATLQTQLDTTNNELRKSQVQWASDKLGIADADAAMRLVDWDEATKAGRSVEETLKALLDDKPYLKKAASDTSESQQGSESEGETNTDGKAKKTGPADTKTASGTPPKTDTTPKIFKKAEVRKLAKEDPDAFNKLYEEGGLKEAMADGRLVD
jgi:hypothetical protein